MSSLPNQPATQSAACQKPFHEHFSRASGILDNADASHGFAVPPHVTGQHLKDLLPAQIYAEILPDSDFTLFKRLLSSVQHGVQAACRPRLAARQKQQADQLP